MLAEINLLPQKQQRNYTNLLVILIVAIMLLGATLTIFSFLNKKNEQIAQLEQEYDTAQQQTTVLQQQASQSTDSDAVSDLEKAIQWSEEYPVDFVPLLNELTKQLPEKGYFYQMDYLDSSSLELIVQFESSSETAYYLKRLKESDLLEEVKLLTVETVPIDVAAEDSVPRYLAGYKLLIDRAALKAFKEEDSEE